MLPEALEPAGFRHCTGKFEALGVGQVVVPDMIVQRRQHHRQQEVLGQALVPGPAQPALVDRRIHGKVRYLLVQMLQLVDLLSPRVQEKLPVKDQRMTSFTSIDLDLEVFVAVLDRKMHSPLESGTSYTSGARNEENCGLCLSLVLHLFVSQFVPIPGAWPLLPSLRLRKPSICVGVLNPSAGKREEWLSVFRQHVTLRRPATWLPHQSRIVDELDLQNEAIVLPFVLYALQMPQQGKHLGHIVGELGITQKPKLSRRIIPRIHGSN